MPLGTFYNNVSLGILDFSSKVVNHQTIVELLSALNLTADITLRQAREGEGPIKVATDLPETQ